MTAPCESPLTDDQLTEYWAHDLAPDGEAAVEAHLFACATCAARLEELSALGSGVAALARQGRLAGIISRALLNQLQHDGVRVRYYSVSPGETIPCAVFPGDDLVVLSMRADLTGVESVNLQVTGPDDRPLGQALDVPVASSSADVLWATPGAFVRAMPSTRLQLTLLTPGRSAALGEYVLEHHAQP